MRMIRNAAVFVSLCLCSARLPAQAVVQSTGSADQTRQVEFGIFLPLQNRAQLDQLLAQMHDEASQSYRHWLSASEFKQQFGPNPSDVAKIRAELARYHIEIIDTHAHGLRVRGTVADTQQAFHTRLANGQTPGGRQRLVADRPLTLPLSLQQAHAAVTAFSPKIRMHTHSMRMTVVPENRYSPVGLYWFDDLKQAYNFPSYKVFSGVGRNIGILMAHDFSDRDMADYFGHEGLPVPNIVRVPVNGGAAFNPSASLEVSLDIQQAGGMAPNATIYDYNVPDLSDVSLIEGLITILNENTVDIVNMSFGGPEGAYSAAYNNGFDDTYILQLYNDLFKQGNAQGITFVASSGDSGALNLPSLSYFEAPLNAGVVAGAFQLSVEFPASSPNVTAVGGTNLVTKSIPGSLNSVYVRENADADPELPYDPYGLGNYVANGYWGSGGGISGVFKKPRYQELVETGSTMRTVPDLSLHMGGCPVIAVSPCGPERSADVARLGGNYYGVIGTSASAPDFAGVLALTEERLGGYRLGNANNLIYSLAAAQQYGIVNIFHQGIAGFNGYYFAQEGVPGYNLVVGNGTLSVRDFMLAPEVPKAGRPRTPSNP